MWQNYKYIVVKTQDEKAEELPFMFPSSVSHDDMMEGIRTSLIKRNWRQCDLISAGFINPHTLVCEGRSETLKVASRPEEDSVLFQTFAPTF